LDQNYCLQAYLANHLCIFGGNLLQITSSCYYIIC
jgi:hypothetical protein